jgi:hypothetical protein
MRFVETIPGMERGGIKENDGGGEFNYDNIIRTFVYVTMPHQYNGNMLIKIKYNLKKDIKSKTLLQMMSWTQEVSG